MINKSNIRSIEDDNNNNNIETMVMIIITIKRRVRLIEIVTKQILFP